jgi:hypothetical protein
VDNKAYKGKLEKRDAGPFWREELQVYVGGRSRTKLVEGMGLQLKAVRAALEADPAYGEITLHPALCFVDSEWSLFARPFEVRGVTIMCPGALRKQLKGNGRLSMRRCSGSLIGSRSRCRRRAGSR